MRRSKETASVDGSFIKPSLTYHASFRLMVWWVERSQLGLVEMLIASDCVNALGIWCNERFYSHPLLFHSIDIIWWCENCVDMPNISSIQFYRSSRASPVAMQDVGCKKVKTTRMWCDQRKTLSVQIFY